MSEYISKDIFIEYSYYNIVRPVNQKNQTEKEPRLRSEQTPKS